MNPGEKIFISLDLMARSLEVERRRIYDIVNVLESVEILSRYCKNQYLWHGFAHIPYTLAKIKVNAFNIDNLKLLQSNLFLSILDSINKKQIFGVHQGVDGLSARGANRFISR